MSDQLKPGDRVRVTECNRVQGYAAGEKCMVQAVASTPAIGHQLHYQVAMNRDGGVSRVVFNAEQIELDVGLIRSRASVTMLPGNEQSDESEERLESEAETTS
jgi:hypothetical protein